MPKKTAKSRQRKKRSKKTSKNKLKKQFKKTLSKKIGFIPLSLILLFLVILLPLVIFLTVYFIASSNDVGHCSDDSSVKECIDNLDQKTNKTSNNDSSNTNNTGDDTESSNSQESDNKQASGSSSPSGSNSSSSASNSKSQGSGSRSDQTSPKSSGEDLKVGSSYMGGTIPKLLDIPTCFGPTLCAWILDGSGYANIYMTEDYHWGGRFLDIVNGRLVTSEKNHWKPSNNKYYYSENIPRLFSNDMVVMAKKYGLRVINKKLYLTIGGVTYSFHSGYTSVVPNPKITVPGGSFSMPPNSQVSFDIKVSPWFYDPEIFTRNYYPYIDNTKVVEFVKLVRKSDGILTITLKSGNYKHGASTGINLFGKMYEVIIIGH